MSTSPTTPTIRIVPGAPPPPPASKSKNKKKKAGAKKSSDQDDDHVVVPDAHTAALIDHAPSESDVKEGSVAPSLVTRQESLPPVSPGGADEPKASPIVDMLNKRLKATGKKITRIQSYSTTPAEKLNEDQKRTLKTLPVLEGIHKELEEVKKVIEVHEAELSRELSQKREEAARAEEQRIQDALASAANAHSRRTADLLSFITLHSALSTGSPAALALNLLEAETAAVFSAIESLLGSNIERKSEIINGFLTGVGSYQDVPYSRFSDITYAFLNPRVPTPPVEPDFLASEAPLEAADIAVGGLPPTIAPTASFQFVQEDELAEEEEALEEAIAEAVAEEASGDVEITETITEVTVNGHTVVEDTVTVTTTTEVPAEASAGLNWAETEDDGGLPSLASLHDRFGSSATGTPAAVPEPLPAETPAPNGSARAPAASAPENDGFQAATRGGGRGGRGRGGYRGGERGGYRGGFRGGERGGRGEHRGGRGFRGGDRGGYRGRGSGDWRGGEGGEFRGRGRGRGRGGSEARGGAVPA